METADDSEHTLTTIDFAKFREYYRDYFHFILDSEDIFRSRPRVVERCLSEVQVDFFRPLFESDCDRHNNFMRKNNIKAGETDDLPSKIRGVLSKSEPGMIGCHYRSIGLEHLRNSKYYGMEPYWNTLDQYIGDMDRLNKKEGCERPRRESTDKERHFSSLLWLYFRLFRKPSTINQQIFNTNHPLGPIGFEFLDEGSPENREMVLRVGTFFGPTVGGLPKLTDLLDKGYRLGPNKPYWFIDFLEHLRLDTFTEDDLLVLEQFKRQLENIRDEIRDAVTGNGTWGEEWHNVQEFIEKRLPHNRLASRVEEVLTLFQSCYLYCLLAGRCVYSFPAAPQPNLPICGWTIVAHKPIAPDVLDFLQRVSEMIYGELIGGTVSHSYQQEFRSSIYSSIQNSSGVFKTTGEFQADITLAACLAESPIPLPAASCFLNFVKNLPEIITYERTTNEFMFVLTHQEFLEGFIDRLPDYLGRDAFDDDRKFARLANKTKTIHRVSSRPVEELFYDDPGSIGLAVHGMRLNGKEFSSPPYVLFFIYPPFDPAIINPDRFFSSKFCYAEYIRRDGRMKMISDNQRDEQPWGKIEGKDKTILDAIERREAIILSEKIKMDQLLKSENLMGRYHSVPRDREDVARALTAGNKETLALIFESDLRMKLFFDGTRILESRHLRWWIPMSDEREFEENLYSQCWKFYDEAGERQDSKVLARHLARGLTRFLDEASRRHKGLFMVFHAGKMPEWWLPLDCVSHVADKKIPIPLKTHLRWEGEFWENLRESSEADGAIVFSQEENGVSMGVYSKIRITVESGKGESDRGREALEKAFEMKSLQAKVDYPELRSYGTKHNTAYDSVLLGEIKGFAVVVSEDGPITIFFREAMNRKKFQEKYGSEDPPVDFCVRIIRK